MKMDDAHYMALAIGEAKRALEADEVPVGCVLVRDDDGVVLGRGFNVREAQQDPTGHAEMLAIREAAAAQGSWRLLGTTAFVTLEPCAMCAGALVLARVGRVVYGCDDPKAGAARTLYRIGTDGLLNHRFELVPGVLGEECAALLSGFFASIRAARKSGAPPRGGPNDR